MTVIQGLFFMIVIQLLSDGYQTFMGMALISLGYGSDIEGGGDSLLRPFYWALKGLYLQWGSETTSRLYETLLNELPVLVVLFNQCNNNEKFRTSW